MHDHKLPYCLDSVSSSSVCKKKIEQFIFTHIVEILLIDDETLLRCRVPWGLDPVE